MHSPSAAAITCLPTSSPPTLTPTRSHHHPRHDNNGRRLASAVTHQVLPCLLSLSPHPYHCLLLMWRRSAHGVHVAEVVCTGPQAGTHASAAAAYPESPTTVSDSGLVVSEQVVGAEEKDEAHTEAPVRGVATHTTPPTEHAADIRPLPSDVLANLPSLSYQPHRIAVVADGRCAVDSV